MHPWRHVDLSLEAQAALYEEASIAASEIVSPNSIEWEDCQERELAKLEAKVWATLQHPRSTKLKEVTHDTRYQ